MTFGWHLNIQAQAFGCGILTNTDNHSTKGTLIYAIFHKICEFCEVGI